MAKKNILVVAGAQVGQKLEWGDLSHGCIFQMGVPGGAEQRRTKLLEVVTGSEENGDVTPALL